ncbi:putative histidine kinase HHK15p [Mytilinidion resinicola]|uniref:Histidine kinase HHK15p n=1 Tax=Mytilinidion resinicola TaxID=574789 RepID=A0A6A6Y7U8_9PEZI|nr:putative histidine kinase HHK15p [Mytilinidion resinicola]KAF2804613.1 putative histidine kinase HHK15p [Mytilinidion resinicola]
MGPRNAERDWTLDLPKSDHVQFTFKTANWAQSRLGPLEGWHPTLRMACRMVFADSRPATLYWGPHYVAVYNEHFVQLAAKVHPRLMGSTFAEGFPELVQGIFPLLERAKETGVAGDVIEAPMMVHRNGWEEEAFFTGNFTPVGWDANGLHEGFYNALFDVTNQKLVERRTNMLNLIASTTDLAPNRVFPHVLASLETNGNDIPMAILYRTEEDPDSGKQTLRLQGAIGVPEGHQLLVDNESIDSEKGLIPQFKEAASRSLIINCEEDDERFKGISWRGFEKPAKNVAILPIISGSRNFGFLVVGTNPCRPFDHACQQFLKDLGGMVSSVITAAVNTEELHKRQEQLENNLAFNDLKVRHLVEHASVGMVHCSLQGDILWANEQYYILAGHTEDTTRTKDSFWEVYMEEDKTKVADTWKNSKDGQGYISVDVRLKRLYKPPIGDPEPAQIRIVAFPYKENGEIKSIMACTTDISQLKWAESWQARLAEDAKEAKRQQESFIDVVSHEMRNPLSAIVHCADSISNSLDECRAALGGDKIAEPYLKLLTENVAAANIVMQCANHQKRIIDDVLTLSKLDSMLLSITPSIVKLPKLVTSMVSIFEAELKTHDIQTALVPENSIAELGIEYLSFDSSRVTQIFINLMTNAIKFVKSKTKREIEIRYGATLSNPRETFQKGIHWPEKGKNSDDVTTNLEWGTGESVYITFLISDTGIGMDLNEVHKIFERFRQANVRTNVKYGGSGLGLFISKELTEKQGGEIGVYSTPGEGSAFAFYIKAKRAPFRTKTLPASIRTKGAIHSDHLQVLLVEDNIINQTVLKKQLEKAGCIVDVANHGLEALGCLTDKRYDVILMDMQMPIMDGLECTTEIRKRQEKGLVPSPLPIIAVTANVRQEQIDFAMTAGADRVMQKPFKAADLVHMMSDLVSPMSAAPLDGDPASSTPPQASAGGLSYLPSPANPAGDSFSIFPAAPLGNLVSSIPLPNLASDLVPSISAATPARDLDSVTLPAAQVKELHSPQAYTGDSPDRNAMVLDPSRAHNEEVE